MAAAAENQTIIFYGSHRKPHADMLHLPSGLPDKRARNEPIRQQKFYHPKMTVRTAVVLAKINSFG